VLRKTTATVGIINDLKKAEDNEKEALGVIDLCAANLTGLLGEILKTIEIIRVLFHIIFNIKNIGVALTFI